MSIIGVVIVVGVAILVFKFILKPLFKIGALIILALIAWWLLNGL